MFDNFQQTLMNRAVNPSGPGALSGSIFAMDFLISFLEIGSVRIKLSSMEILAGMRLRMSLAITS
jgi:hypothetical protein